MKILQYGVVLLCIVALWGCGKGNSNAPVTIDPITKKHPVGWAANGSGGVHPDAYFAASASCEECHGKPSDPAGGISRVSCSNPGRSGVACHPSFPHAAGFAAFAKHGSVARDVASGVTGLAHCQKCHGSGYTGAGTAPSCIGCHKVTNPSSNAPHAANWVSGNANGLKHSLTNETNAPACAQCHRGGTFSHAAPNPAPAGTAPGCFNGTLCHNNAGHTLVGYVVGHRADAKANLASCQTCHAIPASGANPRFNLLKGTGVLNPNGCEGCHNRPGLAHPYMWLPGRGGSTTTSHATAGTVNVSCGLCHGGIALSGGTLAPSCMGTPINGTACHSTKPVDASGTTVGCVSCHAAPPDGTSTSTAPNLAYKHTPHFNNIASLVCDTCHDGFGTGITTHATKGVFSSFTTPTAIPSKFSEGALPATYNPATQKCTNVSCHGRNSVNFPAWKNTAPSTLNRAVCTNCHLVPILNGTDQFPADYTGIYIGPYSGDTSTANSIHNLHSYHQIQSGVPSSPSTVCTMCHATPGVGHYASINLGRRLLAPGFAAGTISGSGIKSYVNHNTTPPSSSCDVVDGCHVINQGVPRSWYK